MLGPSHDIVILWGSEMVACKGKRSITLQLTTVKSARVYGIFGTDKVDHVLVIKGEVVNDIFYRTINRWRILVVFFIPKIQGRPMNYMASIQK